MWQQLDYLARPLRRQSREYIFQIDIRVVTVEACRLDQAHNCRGPFAAAQRASKQPVRASKRPGSDLVLDPVVVDGHGAVVQVARQRFPAFKGVVERLGGR
jgi:hypothetical protein